jgi:DMSO/TMAO reductase YedYZ molybdopterin-dependent catalytic subunit
MTKVHLSRLVLMTVLFVVVHSLVKAQPSSPLPLLIDGEVEKALKLGMPELQKLKQTEVTAKDHSGKPRLYNGVALFDILKEAGVTLGSQLRGKNLLKYVTVKSADGYEVIFSLPEIDPEFTDQSILVAYSEDGKPLPEGDGPFRIVVPNDKKHARWVREITTITVALPH